MRTVRPLDPLVAKQYPNNTVINSRYTVYNFLVLNLYEQFRRPLNFYFLFVACLQFISIIAPVSPLSTLLPLLLAFALTALKEGYDDIKRHRQDALYNNTQRTVLNRNTASWELLRNFRIRVGDIVLLHEDEEIPCDVVVLAASKSTVYIRTDNLDGELDLKPRQVVFTQNNLSKTGRREVEEKRNSQLFDVNDEESVIISKLTQLRFTYPPPSALIDSFDGRVEFLHPQDNGGSDEDIISQLSISYHHLLPQSCVLKNTKVAICLVVYTGDETKCGMNKRPAPVKRAKIDYVVSRYAILLFCFQLLVALVFGIVGFFMNQGVEKSFWYLKAAANESKLSFIIYPLRFFLLTTVMIPVSFKFVADMSKYYMAKTVEWDVSMKHSGATKKGCRVQNSGLLEDLGQVDYILSDKTGTLTQNVMELTQVTVGSEKIFLKSKENDREVESSVPRDANVLQFGRALSLCNTVEVVSEPNHKDESSLTNSFSVQYRASSPDEEALCYGSVKLRVRLMSRNTQDIVLDVDGVLETWTLHYIFPFSPVLKSMGVVVEKKSTGDIFLFIKGADDRICNLAEKSATSVSPLASRMDCVYSEKGCLQEETFRRHLKSYAMEGLRTLVVAEKKICRRHLTVFLEEIRAAELLVSGRSEKIQELRAQMESGVCIIGVTAIEDKLQEGVSETIQSFLQAGIKVWMLTGDKFQTAEQIGLTCSLYDPSHYVLRIVSSGKENDLTCLENMMNISLPPKYGSSPRRRRAGIDSLDADALGYDSGRNSNVLRSEIPTSSSSLGERMMNSYDTMASNHTLQNNFVLVVEGGAVLERILTTPKLTDRFAALTDASVSVICARVTPSQKAAVTNLVRSRGFLTLAIGDGGNDVPMLQEAHVGVGIVGKEGQQASRAADFSITHFEDLHTLLFVHGQQAYTRTAYIIKYSFYKSMLISFIQLAYNILGTYVSGGTFWNSLSLTLWNGMYTLPQTLLYCLDRKTPRIVLEEKPFLYKLTRHGVDMSIHEFFIGFLLRGIVQSVLTLIFVLDLFGTSFAFADTGGSASNDVTFSVAYSALIISQMLTLLFESNSVTFFNALFIFGMPLLYVVVTALYSHVSHLQYAGVWGKTFNVFCFLAAVAVAFALVVPAFWINVMRKIFFPDARDVFRAAFVQNWMSHWRWDNWGFKRRMLGITRWFCMPEGTHPSPNTRNFVP